MQIDKLDALGPALNDVGAEMVEIAGGMTTGLYLYAEAGEAWVSLSLFRDEGDVIRFLDIPRQSVLDDLLLDARDTEPDVKKRWSVMEYVIQNRKFQATFKFSDEIDVESDDSLDERRDAFLKAQYGDKPVIYPPIPEDAFELRPDEPGA